MILSCRESGTISLVLPDLLLLNILVFNKEFINFLTKYLAILCKAIDLTLVEGLVNNYAIFNLHVIFFKSLTETGKLSL